MKQTWKANNPAGIDLGSLGDFIYHETFEVDSLLDPVTVRKKWTWIVFFLKTIP